MDSKKFKTEHIEELITQYAGIHGIDSNVNKMLGIISKYTSQNSYMEFSDIVFLACTLDVSPDYITGVSDDLSQSDLDLLKIIKNTQYLNYDYKKHLSRYSEFLKEIFDTNPVKSDVDVIICNNNGEYLGKTKFPEYSINDEICLSKVAQPKDKYDK